MDFLPTDSCQLVSPSCSVNKHSAVFFSTSDQVQNGCKTTAKYQLCNSGFSWEENTPVVCLTPKKESQTRKLGGS